MATTAGNQYTTFHSIDALLGGPEVGMYGQQYLKRFPMEGKGLVGKAMDIKPHKVFGHGSQMNHQSEPALKSKRDLGKMAQFDIFFE